jgi:hypothetical protein
MLTSPADFNANIIEEFHANRVVCQPRRRSRPTAAIISSVRPSCWSGSAPITHVCAYRRGALTRPCRAPPGRR